MNVSLTPELERLINRKVKSGEYQTASEVVREGLRLIKERDRFARLRADIQKGIDDIQRGDYEDYDESNLHELFEGVKSRGLQRLAELKKNRRK